MNSIDLKDLPEQEPTELAHVELDDLPDLQPQGDSLLSGRLDLIGELKVKLRAIVADAEISVEELFKLKDGSVVPLECGLAPLIEVELDNKAIARGELVVVGDRLGVRITELGSAY
jgi:flagellar motor switch protein FliN/FliY